MDKVDGLDADEWRERLGWTFGLISDHADDRARALDRLMAADEAVAAARAERNRLWQVTLPLGPEQWTEPAFKAAREALAFLRTHTLPDALRTGMPLRDVSIADWPGLPYALLYLEWEARFPEAWTRHSKRWGDKELLLRRLAMSEHNAETTSKLTDLIEIVVARPHRCKDRHYGLVARAIDNGELRKRLADAADASGSASASADSVNPWASIHAAYVLWLMDHPEVPATPKTWRRWLAEGG